MSLKSGQALSLCGPGASVLCSEAAFSSGHAHVLWRSRPEKDRKPNNNDKRIATVVGSPGCAALGEAVLRVADFDGAPVAGSYQADEAQQVGEGPRHIGGVVATRESPSANLRAEERNGYLHIRHI